ncbi:MAG: hypothetical protein HOW73_29645 [Polyangiaceae bacterium]|nr:hypothetical protein [Polyangiaceae bacterium]
MKAGFFAGSLALVFAATGLVGCTDDVESNEDDFTSAQATLLEFEFDGELVTTETFNLRDTIQDQLLYTIGHLNGNRAVGRLDTVQISDITTERQDDGTTLVKYHAILPVAWGSKTSLPKSYDFKLPKRIDFDGLEKFATSYKSGCVEHGAHDVSSGNLWYYYRPNQSGCTLADGDIVKTTAAVTKSLENTEGKYPEFHKVWEDNELRVVAIFGKYEDGATTSSDAGISAYDRFISTAKTTFSGATTTPALSGSAGTKNPDVAIEATLADGRKIVINALLVDNVSTAPSSFYSRYEGLSTEADVIFYNGHAGLGQNVRALAQRGEFRAEKYQIFFMNGCDTFAYVDGSLAKMRSTINPDDPTGTKYMDMVTNAMPAFFSSMPTASMALIKSLADKEKPKSYQDIFAAIDSSQVVVVTGEEDNVFTPDGLEQKWTVAESDVVSKGESVEYSLGTLEPGSYVIAIHEDQAAPGGDADLYVGLGKKPTLETFDFRPWLDGSNEEVTFTLTKATAVNVMVHGYDDMSQETASFKLSGRVGE